LLYTVVQKNVPLLFLRQLSQILIDFNSPFIVAFAEELRNNLPHRLKSVAALPLEISTSICASLQQSYSIKK